MNLKGQVLLGSIAFILLVVAGIYFVDASKTVATSESNSFVDTPSSAPSSTLAAASMNRKIECSSQITQFQNRVLTQERTTNPNASVYDFFIAYSPERDTCVGGYTVYLNYKYTGDGVNMYEYDIDDALTGVNINKFSGSGIDSQRAWEEYKTNLSVLTNGVIPTPSAN